MACYWPSFYNITYIIMDWHRMNMYEMNIYIFQVSEARVLQRMQRGIPSRKIRIQTDRSHKKRQTQRDNRILVTWLFFCYTLQNLWLVYLIYIDCTYYKSIYKYTHKWNSPKKMVVFIHKLINSMQLFIVVA